MSIRVPAHRWIPPVCEDSRKDLRIDSIDSIDSMLLLLLLLRSAATGLR